MEKEFVTYQQALVLQKLGFNEPCLGFFTYKGEIRRYTNFDGDLNQFQTIKNSNLKMGDGWCTVPTYSQAFKWVEDNFQIFIDRVVSTTVNEILGVTYSLCSWKFNNIVIEFENPFDSFDNNRSKSKCLDEIISIINI